MESQENKTNLITKFFTFGSLAIILAISIIFRFHQIDKLSFWNDEIFSFFASKSSITQIAKLDPNMSFYHLLAYFWVKLFPSAKDGLLRLLPAIFSILSIPIVYLLGKNIKINRKKDTLVGLIAAGFVAINAYHIQYAQEFRGYSLLFLLSTLSSLFLLKAVKFNKRSPNSPNPFWFWYALISIAAIYTHFFAVFTLAAQALSLFILRQKNQKDFPMQEVLFSFAFISLFTIPVVNSALTRGASQISWITKPTLDSVLRFAVRITGNQGIPLLGSFSFISLVGFLSILKAKISRNPIKLFELTLLVNCLLLPIILSIAISLLLTPIFLDRYLIFIMPYFTVLSALGLIQITKLGGKKLISKIITLLTSFAIFASIIYLSITGTLSYFKNFQKEDWRSASQFLENNCLGSDNLRLYYMIYTERDATYYAPNVNSQITNWSKVVNKNPSVEDIQKAIDNKPYSKACLIVSHVSGPYVPTLKNIDSALTQKFPKVKTTDFSQIQVKIYENQ